MIQRMLAIWSLVPLPFLKPAWTSGTSWFTYCWSLAWRILSITLLVCEMSAIVLALLLIYQDFSDYNGPTWVSQENFFISKSSSQASAIREPWTSWCSSWFLKRQRNQRSSCQHLLNHGQSKWVPEKYLLCFIDYAKAFHSVDHKKLWYILKEMGIRDHLTCLLRYLYPGQEAVVRTGHGTKDWLQIGKKSMSRLYIVTPLI